MVVSQSDPSHISVFAFHFALTYLVAVHSLFMYMEQGDRLVIGQVS